MKTITDVCKLFNLTPRTLRYYEEIGLLTPKRNRANHRIYCKKELAKIKLIERGKRYNFNLDEIKEMILLFDIDRSGATQLERTIEYGREKVKEIDQRIVELEQIKREILLLERRFSEKLKEMRYEVHDTIKWEESISKASSRSRGK